MYGDKMIGWKKLAYMVLFSTLGISSIGITLVYGTVTNLRFVIIVSSGLICIAIYFAYLLKELLLR